MQGETDNLLEGQTFRKQTNKLEWPAISGRFARLDSGEQRGLCVLESAGGQTVISEQMQYGSIHLHKWIPQHYLVCTSSACFRSLVKVHSKEY